MVGQLGFDSPAPTYVEENSVVDFGSVCCTMLGEDEAMATDYLHAAMEVQGHVSAVCDTEDALKKLGLDKFDAIAFRGVSGALVAPVVGYLLKKPLIAVRKTTEGCHSNLRTETAINGPIRYVVVDDLVCTGDTLRAIDDDVQRHNPGSQMILCITYVHNDTSNRKDVGKWSIPVLGTSLFRSYSRYQLDTALHLSPSSSEIIRMNREADAALKALVPESVAPSAAEWKKYIKADARLVKADYEQVENRAFAWWTGMTGYDTTQPLPSPRTRAGMLYSK